MTHHTLKASDLKIVKAYYAQQRRKLRKITAPGAFSQLYKIVGTKRVVKIYRYGEHSRKETRAYTQMMKSPPQSLPKNRIPKVPQLYNVVTLFKDYKPIFTLFEMEDIYMTHHTVISLSDLRKKKPELYAEAVIDVAAMHVHIQHMAHGDLHGENLFYVKKSKSSPWRLLVLDFGKSSFISNTNFEQKRQYNLEKIRHFQRKQAGKTSTS